MLSLFNPLHIVKAILIVNLVKEIDYEIINIYNSLSFKSNIVYMYVYYMQYIACICIFNTYVCIDMSSMYVKFKLYLNVVV